MDMGCCYSEFHALCDHQTTSKETIHEAPHQSTVINMYANVYIGVTIQKLHQLSDDRITRETLSNNNPCPSSPSSTIYIYIYIYIYIILLIQILC